MIETIELTGLDRRYEHLRLKDRRREQILLSSILEQGILDPLYVVRLKDGAHILLDGFKRYRCAEKLSITSVPVVTLDNNEAMGLLKLIRLSCSKGLSALEEASLVDELHEGHGMSAAEIARRVERSVSWVSARLGMLKEMSDVVRKKIFAGHFPARNYMYTLRPYTRVENKRSRKEIESFITCVSGKGLSTRDIERLAAGYFKGGKMLKAQIQQGNLDWTLRQLKNDAALEDTEEPGLTDMERRVLRNLEIVCGIMHRLQAGLNGAGLTGDGFYMQSQNTVKKLLDIVDEFKETLQAFYEKTRAKTDGTRAVPGG